MSDDIASEEGAAAAREPRVVLAGGRARPSWAGHPNVYSGAVARVEGEPADGAEVDVLDTKGAFIGRGVYHAEGDLRVRIYRRTPGPLDEDLFRRRIRRAVELRRDVLGLDGRADAWRAVHGDGDLLPGVVADRYGEWAVLQVTTRGAAERRAWIAAALLAELPLRGVWERASPAFAKREGFPPGGGRLAGEVAPETVVVTEDGVRFVIDLRGGQKTGHFLDQRENRAAFAALCGGRTVLDVFSGTGAFGLAALVRGGAASVLAVDSSTSALARLAANAEVNGVAERAETRKDDAFGALRALVEEGRRFGAVSVDPPRFASSRRELKGALRGYRDLNAHALRLVERGGVLATSSCTGAVRDEEFETMLRDAAVTARRRVQVLRRGSQAPDHPWLTAVPEGRYLKHILARVL